MNPRVDLISISDVFVVPLAIIVLFFVTFFIYRRNKHVIKWGVLSVAYIIKVITTFLFVFVLMYFYKGYGDSAGYYYEITELRTLVADDFAFIKHEYTKPPQLKRRYQYLKKTPSARITHIGFLFSYLVNNSFIGISLIFSYLGFVGSFYMYKLFVSLFPTLKTEAALATLFLPSVAFWGSGLLKDPITFFATGVVVYYLYSLFFKKRGKIVSLILVVFCSWLIFVIKPYILIAIFPPLIIWLFITRIARIGSMQLKFLSVCFLVIISLFFIRVGVESIAASTRTDVARYSVDKIADEVKRQQHYYNKIGGGSNYSLGQFDPSLGGIAKLFPKAVVASMYRPYLWETRNILMLFNALESALLLFLSIYILFRLGVVKVFRYTSRKPFLMFSIVFSIIFGGLVAISTSNFGSLVRYKIPFVPFFVFYLLVLYSLINPAKRKLILAK